MERYNRIISEEFLHARTWTSEDQRSEAVMVWNVHYNYHRPHSAAAGEPPASRLRQGVANVLASYSEGRIGKPRKVNAPATRWARGRDVFQPAGG